MGIYVPYIIFKMQDYILFKILDVAVEILLFPINALIGLRIFPRGPSISNLDFLTWIEICYRQLS
jgi:hypothetical protein